MATIIAAAAEPALNDARALMRAFVAWHRAAHPEDAHRIDSYFDAAAFERSLASLPGEFGPPGGGLVVAYRDGRAAGCCAFRRLDDATCEMKRMFIPPAFRGLGIGRALADRILADAKAAGYRRMRLETSVRQTDAIRLYERAGFRPIPAYNPAPPELADWLVSFERALEPSFDGRREPTNASRRGAPAAGFGSLTGLSTRNAPARA